MKHDAVNMPASYLAQKEGIGYNGARYKSRISGLLWFLLALGVPWYASAHKVRPLFTSTYQVGAYSHVRGIRLCGTELYHPHNLIKPHPNYITHIIIIH
jgi:hypothetical protein